MHTYQSESQRHTGSTPPSVPLTLLKAMTSSWWSTNKPQQLLLQGQQVNAAFGAADLVDKHLSAGSLMGTHTWCEMENEISQAAQAQWLWLTRVQVVWCTCGRV